MERYPAYKNVPFTVRRAIVYTLGMLTTLPTWTMEDYWKLVEMYYSMLKVGTIKTLSGLILTIPEALRHIKRRTNTGKWLMQEHAKFLEYIIKKMVAEGYA